MVSLASVASLLPSTRLPPLRARTPATPTPFLSALKPSPSKNPIKGRRRKKIGNGSCRAELSPDAPLAAAIGACMLSSLVLPVSAGSEDEEDGTVVDSTDARFAVMGIVSFIPYFNWLSWVFAWLDTGKRRYGVYALVYLAPYLRSNLSLSPEESWLPIASILFCIVHVQLEASMRNGDIQGFQLFNKAAKLLSSISGKKDGHQGSSESKRKHMDLPTSDTRPRNEIRQWDVPRRPSQDQEHKNGDWDDDERREK
ncbi:uncharacterized protein LOC115732936 isoform X2 [Rhodamnia argentea]|uniref:Uncharacterized protein LOC115732936 isoform X2 n=1 Tax=Rhodamnia argentea TaxID=178133 RepID=A0ABM3HYP1_9MYRT|nr:uncharacterized protein LOC115732936 isoform X2 [Rhodamnia argentea]